MGYVQWCAAKHRTAAKQWLACCCKALASCEAGIQSDLLQSRCAQCCKAHMSLLQSIAAKCVCVCVKADETQSAQTHLLKLSPVTKGSKLFLILMCCKVKMPQGTVNMLQSIIHAAKQYTCCKALDMLQSMEQAAMHGTCSMLQSITRAAKHYTCCKAWSMLQSMSAKHQQCCKALLTCCKAWSKCCKVCCKAWHQTIQQPPHKPC